MGESARHVLIVGASAAGLRCACRLARLRPRWRIAVVEERATFSWAACGLPYFLSGDIAGADALRRTGDGALRDARYFSDVKGVEVVAGTRAVGIDCAARTLRVIDRDGERSVPWDELVLATGAQPRRLPALPEHPRVHTFHTPEDAATLHEGLARGAIRRVVVIGAGFVGCELSEAFRALWDADVTLVEAADTPLPLLLDREVGRIVSQVLVGQGVRLRTGSPVERVEADGREVRVVARGETLVGDAAVLALGVTPATALAAEAGIALDPSGAVTVDERMATSQPHVWAVGDCAGVRLSVTGARAHLPLGSLANRQGRVLANVLAGVDDRFGPVVGAAALKVFDSNVACVGMTRSAARARGTDARSIWISSLDRAHYWPDAKEIAVHLVYEAVSRRVLGVQAVGEGDAVKRVDAAAQLMTRGAALDDLARLEHAYAPPYAPALDPLAVAAFAALNQEDGVPASAPDEPLDGVALLDVRHSDEREARPAPAGALVGETREEILRCAAGLAPGTPLVIVCERGTRSAEAVRLLRGNGFPARYLGGGLRWRTLAGMGPGLS